MAEIIIKPLLYSVTFDSQTRELTFKRKDGASIYSCTLPSQTLVDDMTKPLMFKSRTDGAYVRLARPGEFQVSSDAEHWEDYTNGTNIPLNRGECVFFRVKTYEPQGVFDYGGFATSNIDRDHGDILAYHNVNSLLSQNFADMTDLTGYNYAFYRLFYSAPYLVRAPLLPATVLCEACYAGMFSSAQLIETAPVLPASFIPKNAYASMFRSAKRLSYVTCLATEFEASSSTTNWLYGVSATGDFYTPQATNWETGASGIPDGWTRHDL